MNQCLQIAAVVTNQAAMSLAIQQKARSLKLEGVVQALHDGKLVIVACGTKDRLDELLDLLHQEVAKKNITTMEIEPFVKTKDYRGVFRIIE